MAYFAPKLAVLISAGPVAPIGTQWHVFYLLFPLNTSSSWCEKILQQNIFKLQIMVMVVNAEEFIVLFWKGSWFFPKRRRPGLRERKTIRWLLLDPYYQVNPNPGGFINVRFRLARSHIWPPRQPIEEREALRHAAAVVGSSAPSLRNRRAVEFIYIFW